VRRWRPEWAPQKAIWTTFPGHPDLWKPHLNAAQAEVADMVRALAETEDEAEVILLVRDGVREAQARDLLDDLPRVRFVRMRYGDIWTRDIGPLFLEENGEPIALCFAFNGWGGKYVMDGDEEVGPSMAEAARVALRAVGVVAEGGALEHDGDGTLLTTRNVLLNANRNPGVDESTMTGLLREQLGVSKVIWIEGSLEADHTDGHIDTLARFVAPGRVLCMRPSGEEDPNRVSLGSVREQLEAQALEVETIPSPGIVRDSEGEAMPASYLNYVLSNDRVVVPTYGSPWDEEAVAAIGDRFPGREAVGRSAKTILLGGGAFHCITQNQPR
jgi:agmatine deiminase